MVDVRFERVVALPAYPATNTLYFVKPAGAANIALYVTGNDGVPHQVATNVGGGDGYSDEQVRDVIAAALRQGTNVTIVVDDEANTITIGASGGGGGPAAWSDITGKPTTIAGYGITDAVVRFDQLGSKPTTLAGYGITDAQSATGNVAWSRITVRPTTLAGYGITDAQPLDADLTAIAALTTTSFGRNQLTLADAAGGRTAFGLGTAATLNTGTTNGTIPLIGANGKLPAALMPAVAITDTFVVASQAEQLALTAERGDVAIRTDLNKSFILRTDDPTVFSNWQELLAPSGGGGSSGTVTSVAIVTANGVSGNVANASTTPAITLTLGAITPTSVAATGNVTGANLSGTNTGDQTNVPGNAGTATKLATARTINGVAFDGTAPITVPAVDTATPRLPLTELSLAVNFTAAADAYIPARVAQTIAQGNAPIGTGSLAYAKSTAAAPSTFTTTTLPATLEAGAWLKVSATAVTGFLAADLYRSA